MQRNNRIWKQNVQPLPGQNQHGQLCSCWTADKPSCWPWSNLSLWLSGCECQRSAAASSRHHRLEPSWWEWRKRKRGWEYGEVSAASSFTIIQDWDHFKDYHLMYRTTAACPYYTSTNYMNLDFSRIFFFCNLSLLRSKIYMHDIKFNVQKKPQKWKSFWSLKFKAIAIAYAKEKLHMLFLSPCCHNTVFAALIRKNRRLIKAASTCGDIFPDASDRDGGPFYSVSISILNYSLYPPMDLFTHTRKPHYFLLLMYTWFFPLVLAASLTLTDSMKLSRASLFLFHSG